MKHSRGFIALISSILISSALLAIAVSTGVASMTARAGAMRGEYKKISYSLAESCVQSALLRLAQNYSYQPPAAGDSVAVGNAACAIASVDTESSDANGKTVRIVSAAHYQSAYTLLHVDATIPNPAVSSAPLQVGAWQEVL